VIGGPWLYDKKEVKQYMAWWSRKKEKPIEQRDISLEDLLLSSSNDASTVSKEQAMNVPSLNSGVNLISNTVASLPIKLYKKDGQKISCMDDDPRVNMLNVSTGDLLDGFQMKKALVEDYLVYGAGYMYINRQRNNVASLNYVSNPQVGVALINPDPIFKNYEFIIYGATYKAYQLVKLTRKTRDGVTGLGVLNELNRKLSIAYNTMLFEDMLVRTGGNKKGFLKSASRLGVEAMTALKNAFKAFYSNNSENIIVLNNGLEFQEANNSSVEMQLNQNKITDSEEIAKVLNVPVELLDGKVTNMDGLYDAFIKLAVLPILKAFETALNKDLLLESEKGSFYFEFEKPEPADMLKRFQSYDLAVKNGILQVDEIRAKENYEPLGFDYIKLGLQDVLYDPDTKQIYTPNTNKLMKMGEPAAGDSPTAGNQPIEGGEVDESGNQE
jgi:HK97 family phage portal protein